MADDWRATYRLQLHAEFPLPAATALLPYLAQLGISHVYLSPCWQAVRGSRHGYDVTDPTHVSDELGGEAAWREFSAQARAQGLGVLLDIVPNHMAASAQNPWWDDFLAHGPCSRYATFFDVFTAGPGRPRVQLATLGQSYGQLLAAGGLKVEIVQGRPRVVGEGQSWPLTPASWQRLLPPSLATSPVFAELEQRLAQGSPDGAGLVAYELAVQATVKVWERGMAEDGDLAALLAEINADPACLHELLEAQHYELHSWKLQGETTNYRRFFDVDALVGLRMEDEAVFAATHARLLAMVRDGEVQGCRIDHPDGLREPAAYFRRLRAAMPNGRLYLEKILQPDERLREDWPVEGTAGYDFLNKVNLLWMDADKSDALSALYGDFTGHTVNLPRLVREKKTAIIDSLFAGDVERLTDQAMALARGSWRTRDLSRAHLRLALAEVTALLPLYRTYGDERGIGPEDRAVLTSVLAQLRARWPALEPELFAFLDQLLLGENTDPAMLAWLARWQQLTPAVTAKGVEDTTFYCYDRLVSCNEVGAQPSALGISSEKFHEFCHHLAERWPETLLATSTHDTKRSEDVRARISVLTEDTERWGRVLAEWSTMNLPAWRGREPDRHAEYLLYQTLVGAWPLEEERARAYLLKACREAKIHTSWREPNTVYEQSIQGFVAGLYASPEFLRHVEVYASSLLLPGRINSLAQTLLKLTAPGVPDFYQGSEWWDLSLVDPDNRRPVDYAGRRAMLAQCADRSASDVLQQWDAGWPKLWVIQRTLALRRAHPAWFARGSTYAPLTASGARIGHVLGFVRGGSAITLVPRFTHTLRGEWGDTRLRLPAGQWQHAFTQERWRGEIRMGELFQDFPVALLSLLS